MTTNCPVCVSNATNESLSKTFEMSREIINQIYDNIDSIKDNLTDEDSGYLGLLSPSLGILVDMSNGLFTPDDFQIIEFASSTRIVIERLSDLIYITTKGPLKYKKYNELFIGNSMDIHDICTFSSGKDLSTKWLSQRWTGLSREKRISYFENDEFLVAYGYASRIVHGINRDYLLRDKCDVILVKYYFYLISNMAMCLAVKKLSGRYIPEVTSKKASALFELVSFEWRSKGLNLRNILNLTTFSTYFSTAKQSEFLIDLRQKILKAYTDAGFPSYVLVSNSTGEHKH